VRLGVRVSEGTKLGEIADPFGEEESEVVSSGTGVVIGRLILPLVHRGDALFHIACFKRPSQVADTLEAFKEEFRNTAG
jgi:predicted deacylase